MNGKFHPTDKNGIVNINEQSYFIPALSEIYSKDRNGKRYKFESAFLYKPSSINFNQWSNKFNELYHHDGNAPIAISFLVAVLYRDIIYKLNNKYFPLLYLQGAKDSGKSSMAKSLQNIFCPDNKLFNLFSGTDAAFFSSLELTSCTLRGYDEYRNKLPLDKIEALKNAADGSGEDYREGPKTKRVLTTDVSIGLAITGQEMPTAHDNAVGSRSLILECSPGSNKYDSDDRNNFSEFAELERLGLSNIIVELLSFRDLISQHCKQNFLYISNTLKGLLKKKKENIQIQGRLLKKYACIATPICILMEHATLPFLNFKDVGKVLDHFADKLYIQNSQFSKTDAVQTFWDVLLKLYTQSIYIENNNENGLKGLKNRELTTGKFRKGVNYDLHIDRNGVHRLFIHFGTCYLLYSEDCKRTNTECFGKSTLKSYLLNREGFMKEGSVYWPSAGGTKGTLIFDYNKIDVDFGDKEIAEDFSFSTSTEENITAQADLGF